VTAVAVTRFAVEASTLIKSAAAVGPESAALTVIV
jgi:hypothetical protein